LKIYEPIFKNERAAVAAVQPPPHIAAWPPLEADLFGLDDFKFLRFYDTSYPIKPPQLRCSLAANSFNAFD
jgi:hypothetical protein